MRIWLLSILALSALAGCIEGDDAQPDEPASTDGVQDEAEPAAASSCKNFENYGLIARVGQHYYYTGPDGPTDSRVYEEDNGLGGLQTEESCPENPDSRVA